MLFCFSIEAMSSNEQIFNCLDIIMGRVEDSVHELEIIDADLLMDTPWYKSLRPIRKKFVDEISTFSLHKSKKTQGPHFHRIRIEDYAEAEKAKNYSNTPVSILLENSESDGALVTAALRVFGSEETRRLAFLSPSKLAIPAIIYESRGGHGELKKLIESKISSATLGAPLRSVAITDSDGEYSGDIKPHAMEIRGLCNENNIPCPPLHKRTAENYIPDVIWDELSRGIENIAKKPMVDALKRLSPEQRDHIRMDNNSAPWNKENPLAQQLFSSVSESDLRILSASRLKGKGVSMTINALNTHAHDSLKNHFEREIILVIWPN